MEARRSGRSARGRSGPRGRRRRRVHPGGHRRPRRARSPRRRGPTLRSGHARGRQPQRRRDRRCATPPWSGWLALAASPEATLGARGEPRSARSGAIARAGHAGPIERRRRRRGTRPWRCSTDGRRRSAASPATPLDAGTRLLALERLTDAAELEAVAHQRRARRRRRGGARPARRRRPPNSSRAIAQRARTKAAAKRAKALLAALTAAPAPADAAAVEYKDADQDGRAGAGRCRWRRCRRRPMPAAVRDGYAAARVAWVELLADAEVAAGDRRGVRDAVGSRPHRARRRRSRGAPTRPVTPRRCARSRPSRLALCERVEALAGDDLPDRAGRGARRVGRPAADGRGVGAPTCSAASTRRRARPSAGRRSSSRRASWPARRRRSSPRRKGSSPPTTPRSAASGRRCAASGRRSAGSATVEPALAERFADGGGDLRGARAGRARRAGSSSQEENLHRLQARRAGARDPRRRRVADAQGRRRADQGRQAGHRHDGPAADAAGPRGPHRAAAGGAGRGARRGSRSCATPRSGSAGPTSRCRKTCARRWRRSIADRRGRAREGRHRDAGAAGEVEAGGGGAALAGRGAVDALQGGPGRRSTRSARTSSRSRPPNGRRR